MLRCTAEANEVAILGDSEAEILAEGACTRFTGAGCGRLGLAGHFWCLADKVREFFFPLSPCQGLS